MAPYVTYTKFYSPENAQFLVTLLQGHDIPYTLNHEVNQLDKVYIGESVDPMYELKIPGNRFQDVHALLAEQAKADMARPGFEHYLQTYSAAELQDLLREPSGWNAYDVQVATALLWEKAEEHVIVPVKDAIAFTPVKVQKRYIVLGYLAAIMGITGIFYLSAAGFFAGLAIIQSKKTLSNGETVSLYTKEDHRHGRIMIILSLLCMSLVWYIVYSRQFYYSLSLLTH